MRFFLVSLFYYNLSSSSCHHPIDAASVCFISVWPSEKELNDLRKELAALQKIEDSAGPGKLLKVGRCTLTVSKPVLKAPMASALEATICW